MSQAGVQELLQPLAGLATGKVMVSPSLSFPGGGRALSGAEGGILTGVPGGHDPEAPADPCPSNSRFGRVAPMRWGSLCTHRS